MKINRPQFYDRLRGTLFRGGFSGSQVAGIERLLSVFEESYAPKWEQAHGPLMALQLGAYCLATSYWETAQRMVPVYEALAKTPAQAQARLEKWYQTKHPKVTPYWRDGWFGRGDVQLTHLYNYEMGTDLLREAGIDANLVANPELAMDPINSAHILFAGSYEGRFTGKALALYIDQDQDGDFEDYVHARRVINGTDKAWDIALIAQSFELALLASTENAAAPVVISTPAPADIQAVPETTGKPILKTTTFWTSITGVGTTVTAVLNALGNINPWLAALLIVVAVGVAAWLIRERQLKSFLYGV